MYSKSVVLEKSVLRWGRRRLWLRPLDRWKPAGTLSLLLRRFARGFSSDHIVWTSLAWKVGGFLKRED